VPLEWAATSLVSAPDVDDRAAHIIQGDIVRVVRGSQQHRTGRVVTKHDHGVSLSLRDMKTNELVSSLS
jgi:hypothetical protein